jgi:hypothetical protein
VTDWGDDLVDIIASVSDMETEVFSENDVQFGVEGEFLEVFLSRKSPASMGG